MTTRVLLQEYDWLGSGSLASFNGVDLAEYLLKEMRPAAAARIILTMRHDRLGNKSYATLDGYGPAEILFKGATGSGSVNKEPVIVATTAGVVTCDAPRMDVGLKPPVCIINAERLMITLKGMAADLDTWVQPKIKTGALDVAALGPSVLVSPVVDIKSVALEMTGQRHKAGVWVGVSNAHTALIMAGETPRVGVAEYTAPPLTALTLIGPVPKVRAAKGLTSGGAALVLDAGQVKIIAPVPVRTLPGALTLSGTRAQAATRWYDVFYDVRYKANVYKRGTCRATAVYTITAAKRRNVRAGLRGVV